MVIQVERGTEPRTPETHSIALPTVSRSENWQTSREVNSHTKLKRKEKNENQQQEHHVNKLASATSLHLSRYICMWIFPLTTAGVPCAKRVQTRQQRFAE